ncbi:MAG: response regulator transcription factor [Anaerolineae bacterium]|nr:response regulator transcription factor [Anaerolineae bacterium]
MTDHIKILVVDDHMVVREGLRALLTPRNGMEVIGEAVDGGEAVEMARTLSPDVILMDLNLPEKSGLEATAEIMRQNPHARILVLTSYEEEEHISAAVRAGALGYVLKNSSAPELFHAIRGVAMGSLSVSSNVTQILLKNFHQPAPAPPPSAPTFDLTERELDVLRGLAQGQSNQEIAESLNVEKTTVRSHISRILSKLGVDNRTQAALYAIEMGLSQPKEKR